MNLITFYLRQIYRHKKNILLFFSALVVIAFVFASHLDFVKNQIIYKQIYLRQLEFSYNDLQKDQSICLDNLKERIDLEKEILDSNDFNLIYDCQIRLLDMDLEAHQDSQALVMDKAFLQYLKNHNLAYDQYDHPVLAIPFVFFVMRTIIIPLIFLLMIIVLVDLYSKKYKHKIDISVFLTRRKTTKEYIMAGFIWSLVSSLLWLLFAFCLSYIISGLGSLDYPVVINYEFVCIQSVLLSEIIKVVVLLLCGVITTLVVVESVKEARKSRLILSILFLSFFLIYFS